jgi:hypothetical protein
LRQFVADARKVYGLTGLLAEVVDGRRTPPTPSRVLAAVVFYTGLLRIRSFNALEPRLEEKPFVQLVGAEHSAFSCVDTVSRSLRVMDIETSRAVSVSVLAKAERNKVFREGWHGALRYFAVDGWEPVCSRNRHCSGCLVRQVRVKGPKGKLVKVKEYYHRYAVALLIGPRFDLVLDIEPVLSKDVRPAVVKGKKRDRLVRPQRNEGELTAASRLIRRVKGTFGWVDVVVADALYANGPFLSTAKQLGLGAVVVVRKETDEPLKEALRIWGKQPPHRVVEDEAASERIELWDCPELETLDTYEGKIRVVRALVTNTKEAGKDPSQWCFLVTGAPARRLSPEKVLAVGRGRWHIENTGFRQWTTCWYFDHVFVHDARGMLALYWLFFTAFNLLTLFLYCQLRCYGRDRGTDTTRTISRLIDEMRDDLVTLGYFDSS